MDTTKHMDALTEYQKELRVLAEEARAQATVIDAMADDVGEAQVAVAAGAVPHTLTGLRNVITARAILARHKWEHAIGVWFYVTLQRSGLRGVVSTSWSAVERAWKALRPHTRV